MLVLAIRFYREAIIALLIVALAITAVLYEKRGIHIEHIKSEHELEITTLKLDYISKARQIESENYEQVIKAVNESKEREQIIINDAADSRAAVNSLSDTIEKLASTAKTDAEFRDKYANATGNLLKECSGAYSEMAEAADRIANDLRLIQSARK